MSDINASGSGYASYKPITERMIKDLDSQNNNLKKAHNGKLSTQDVHALIRTAANDDGQVSKQELDWINGYLANQGDKVSAIDVKKSSFGEVSQFQFTVTKKDGKEEKGDSVKIQEEAGKKLGQAGKTMKRDSTSGDVTGIHPKNLADLERMTQKMTTSNVSENKCGASCIVSGALYSQGRDGLIKLVDGLKGFIDSKNLSYGFPDGFSDIISKVKDKVQNLTKQDISKLQDMVYLALHNYQDDRCAKANLSSAGGLQTQIMKEFIESPQMKGVFDNSVKIRNIDNDGDGKANHYVMFMDEPNKKSAVYDPWPRKDGKQVVTSQSVIDTYRAAISDS